MKGFEVGKLSITCCPWLLKMKDEVRRRIYNQAVSKVSSAYVTCHEQHSTIQPQQNTSLRFASCNKKLFSSSNKPLPNQRHTAHTFRSRNSRKRGLQKTTPLATLSSKTRWVTCDAGQQGCVWQPCKEE